MSVRCEHYLILGTKLNIPDDKRDGVVEQFSEAGFDLPWCGRGAKGKLGILWDGMGGRYVLAGKCLAVADEEGNSFDCMEVTQPDSEDIFEVSGWIHSSDLLQYCDGGMRTFLVSHYH